MQFIFNVLVYRSIEFEYAGMASLSRAHGVCKATKLFSKKSDDDWFISESTVDARKLHASLEKKFLVDGEMSCCICFGPIRGDANRLLRKKIQNSNYELRL